MTARHVVLLGLGEISRYHRAVLAERDDAVVVAGVDPDPQVHDDSLTFPTYSRLRDALQKHQPDLIIIATPTAMHADHVIEARSAAPNARLLVEKPMASTQAELERLIPILETDDAIVMLQHAAYGPEVGWALERMEALTTEFGPIVSLESFFADPYALIDDSIRSSTWGDPWLDSGINALGILDRFMPVTSLEQRYASPDGLTRQVWALTDHGVEGPIITTWAVAETSKSTRLKFASGAVLRLDHQACAATLLYQGQVTDHYGSTAPRLLTHYRRLFDDLATSGWSAGTTRDRQLHLHRLLLGA